MSILPNGTGRDGRAHGSGRGPKIGRQRGRRGGRRRAGERSVRAGIMEPTHNQAYSSVSAAMSALVGELGKETDDGLKMKLEQFSQEKNERNKKVLNCYQCNESPCGTFGVGNRKLSAENESLLDTK